MLYAHIAERWLMVNTKYRVHKIIIALQDRRRLQTIKQTKSKTKPQISNELYTMYECLMNFLPVAIY